MVPVTSPNARPPQVVDPELAERLDAQGDPNGPLADGQLPLRRALDVGALKQARRLLKMGADPRRLGGDGRTCLAAAIESGYGEFVRRYRNAARALAREDGSAGVMFVDGVEAEDAPHVIAFRKDVDQVASSLKTHNGWKPNRRAAERVVLLEQSQAFLFRSGGWALVLFHATTDRRREIERSQWEVRLSMDMGPAIGIRGARACRFVDGYPETEFLREEAHAFLEREGIRIPPHRFRSDGVSLVLEFGGLGLGDVEPVIELPIMPL